MRTQLDTHEELYLEKLCEDDHLVCWVRPMIASTSNTKVPSVGGLRYRIEFKHTGDYLVLQEITNSVLGLRFLDDGHLSEVDSGQLLDIFKQREIFPTEDIRNFALRTAHCVIHIFSSQPPEIFLEGEGQTLNVT